MIWRLLLVLALGTAALVSCTREPFFTGINQRVPCYYKGDC